jgi:hypothetical protein
LIQRLWRLGRSLATGLFFVFVQGNLFEVVGVKDLIAVLTSQVVDPVSPHQELRALVFTARHRMQIIPILMNAVTLSSPQMVLGEA